MIAITEKAAQEFITLSEKEGKNGAALRVFVAGMGCGGPQYGMAFEEEKKDEDLVLESEGVTIYVDKGLESFFDGAKIEFQENEHGSGFLITNPNSSAGNSCGSGCSGC